MCLFGLAQAHLPFPFVVNVIRAAFPGCEGVDPATGRHIRIEFELRSRHFDAYCVEQAVVCAARRGEAVKASLDPSEANLGFRAVGSDRGHYHISTVFAK